MAIGPGEGFCALQQIGLSLSVLNLSLAARSVTDKVLANHLVEHLDIARIYMALDDFLLGVDEFGLFVEDSMRNQRHPHVMDTDRRLQLQRVRQSVF